MLVQGGKAETPKRGFAMAREHLSNGKCWKKFREMVSAQGGDVSVIDRPDEYPVAKFSVSEPCVSMRMQLLFGRIVLCNAHSNCERFPFSLKWYHRVMDTLHP